MLTHKDTGQAWGLGLLHGLVDATSLALLYREAGLGRQSYDDLCRMFLLYNGLAFGLQPFLGVASDRLSRGPLGAQVYSATAALGTGLAALAVLLAWSWAWPAVVCVAVGNALFHVGAGALVLRRCAGWAALPGIFVAPGALGVWLGIRLGTNPSVIPSVFAFLLVVASLILVFQRSPEPDREPLHQFHRRGAFALTCLLALLLSVTVRSLAGGVFSAVGASYALGLVVTLAAFLGKSSGGWLADLLGWRRLALVSLLVLWVLQSGWVSNSPEANVASMLLIQLAMPITLTATFLAMPRFPGLAFGLPSLALLVGALPGQLDDFPWAPAEWLWLLIPASALLLFWGLSAVRRNPEGVRRTI